MLCIKILIKYKSLFYIHSNSFQNEKEAWKLFSVILKWIKSNDKINMEDGNEIYIEILELIFKIVRNANAGVRENQMNTK